MKNQIFNLGKALNKAEQKQINGGDPGGCTTDFECWEQMNFRGPEDAYACINGSCSFAPSWW